MAVRAAKVCGHPGCAELAPCPTHRVKAWGTSTRRKRTVSGSRQQKRARWVLRRDDYICHYCGLYGADQADHVVPLAEGGHDGVENMAPIHAHPCHAKKTAAESKRGRT